MAGSGLAAMKRNDLNVGGRTASISPLTIYFIDKKLDNAWYNTRAGPFRPWPLFENFFIGLANLARPLMSHGPKLLLER